MIVDVVEINVELVLGETDFARSGSWDLRRRWAAGFALGEGLDGDG
jgi:hypothetical protein